MSGFFPPERDEHLARLAHEYRQAYDKYLRAENALRDEFLERYEALAAADGERSGVEFIRQEEGES